MRRLAGASWSVGKMQRKPPQSEGDVAKAKAIASLGAITDEEDAALTRAAEADPDNLPLTEEAWAEMRPAKEAIPDVVEAWRKTGSGWQSRMGAALKRAIGR